MNRYVDIDNVINLFGISDSDIDAKWTIENALYDGSLSLADVEPVKHGHWISKFENGEVNTYCSACGNITYGLYRYCPDCGARMDEVAK